MLLTDLCCDNDCVRAGDSERGDLMKQYDIKCPVCGTTNHGLYLEETNGRMECENCHSDVQILGHDKFVAVPVYDRIRRQQAAAAS